MDFYVLHLLGFKVLWSIHNCTTRYLAEMIILYSFLVLFFIFHASKNVYMMVLIICTNLQIYAVSITIRIVVSWIYPTNSDVMFYVHLCTLEVSDSDFCFKHKIVNET